MGNEFLETFYEAIKDSVEVGREEREHTSYLCDLIRGGRDEKEKYLQEHPEDETRIKELQANRWNWDPFCNMAHEAKMLRGEGPLNDIQLAGLNIGPLVDYTANEAHMLPARKPNLIQLAGLGVDVELYLAGKTQI
ncbi:hypothetical protein COU57_04040 [Candidatus Pacearchaeota archaeon CG10_big_fil_rev_8_21_14_0_10_32_14]|nr:MAG: hypothetical protein COU57_04040 [Candidatus Pacearchaeota archaeon CG10_big_fil_rev_8_21_14_0_10_32_14]